MPRLMGFGGYQTRPRRKNQLDLPKVHLSERIPLRVSCESCGEKSIVAVKAKDYYSPGFRIEDDCAICGKPLRKQTRKTEPKVAEG